MPVTSVFVPAAYAQGTYSPSFDTTQATTANRIDGEIHYITPGTANEKTVIFPFWGPFFSTLGLVVRHTSDGGVSTVLQPGVDMFLGLPFHGARQAGLINPLYGAIVLNNPNLSGTITLTYRTIGQPWVYRRDLASANQFAILNNVVTTSQEQYANYQSAFPVVGTPFLPDDQSKLTEVYAGALTQYGVIAENFIKQKADHADAIAHWFRKDNPHQETKVSVGLGNVANLPAATDAQASDPTNNSTYITPAQIPLAFANITPVATDSVAGAVILNVGATTADGGDATKALTAAGFVALINNADSDLSKAINQLQKTATFSPWPATWPTTVTWRGAQYTTVKALMAALAAHVGVSVLEHNPKTGKVWFPSYVTIPTMTLT